MSKNKLKRYKIPIILLSLFIFAGCSGVQTEVHTIVEGDYWQRVAPIVKSDNLEIGMDKSRVEDIMGVPDKKIKQEDLIGSYNKLIYKPEKYPKDSAYWVYLTFHKNELINIQRPSNF